MAEQNQAEVNDGQVVSLDYTLTVEGELVDSSESGKPIEFIQGQQHIIRGLEKELYGMKVGDKKEVVVQPGDGYGDVDPENYADVPRGQFPEDIPLDPGVELELQDESGELILARIELTQDDTVRLDFNHPLAGKELHFDVKVVSLREATPEEMEHGHVHEGDHHE